MTNQLELNKEICDSLIDMSKSIDIQNKTVVSEIINHCNMELNLPYIMILYKFLPVEHRDSVFTKDILEKLKTITNVELDANMSYNAMYEILRTKKCNDSSMIYFIEKFCATLSIQLENWGFTFLKDYKLNMIKR